MTPEIRRRLPGWSFAKVDTPAASRPVESEIEIWRDVGGLLTLSRAGDFRNNAYRLRFAEQIAVDLMFAENSLIEIANTDQVPESTREHFLIDQVLPRILAHYGQLVLHAGAVRLDGKAVVIMGRSGAGKSTLCAGLEKMGHPLMGDDALVVTFLNGRPQVAAVYPSLRLLPDTIAQLYPESVTTSSVAHYTTKRRVRLPLLGEDDGAAVEIGSIFVIDHAVEAESAEVRSLSASRSCMALIENSFILDPTDMSRVSARLENASKIAGHVPTFCLRYPRDYGRLGEVRDAILTAIRGS